MAVVEIENPTVVVLYLLKYKVLHSLRLKIYQSRVPLRLSLRKMIKSQKQDLNQVLLRSNMFYFTDKTKLQLHLYNK